MFNLQKAFVNNSSLRADRFEGAARHRTPGLNGLLLAFARIQASSVEHLSPYYQTIVGQRAPD